MRFAILLAVLAFSGASAYCEPAQSHEINSPSPEPIEEGIRRPRAAKSEQVGLTGKLIWVNELLVLQTPSGARYGLNTKDKALQEKLIEASEKKETGIELGGALSEGKFKVESIESTFDSNGKRDAEFVISFSKNLSSDDFTKLISEVKALPGAQLFQVSPYASKLMVKSDFSLTHLKNKISENAFLKQNVTATQRSDVSRVSSK